MGVLVRQKGGSQLGMAHVGMKSKIYFMERVGDESRKWGD
jgi:hypothetical protein